MRYSLKFSPPIEMSGDIVEDTARVQAAVERAVREYPDQWLWIHRRWKTRPPGEIGLAPGSNKVAGRGVGSAKPPVLS